MATHKVFSVLDGIEIDRHRDQEVKMEFPHGRNYIEAQGGRTIYTESITQCAAIATFDQINRDRTLCHAAGSEFTEEYFIRLAGHIRPQTTIILCWGTDWSPGAMAEMTRDRWKRQLTECMARISKKADQLDWLEFWQPPENAAPWLFRATFALRADGGFGLVQSD